MRFVQFALVSIFAAALSAILPRQAHAQLYPFREHVRQLDSGRMALGADLSTFFGRSGDAKLALIQPTPVAAFRYRELVLEAAVPFAVFHENTDDDGTHTRLTLGNPWFAAAYLPDCGCGLSRLSLGVAAPAARDSNDHDARALAVARAAHGDWDGYLYRPDFMPLVAGASTRMERGRFNFIWDGDLIMGMPGGGRDFDIGTQHALEADAVFGWDITLGARISAAYYPTLPGDKFQSATSAFFRYAWVDNTLALRFVLNLDPPGGFSFSRDGVWGAGLNYARSFL